MKLKPPVAPSAAAGPRRRRTYRAPAASPAATAAELAEQPARRRLPGLAHRAEQVAAHGRRDQAGRHVAAAPDQHGDAAPRSVLPVATFRPRATIAAQRGHDAAGGGRDRVGHDQLVLGYHVRQRRRQRGQEEPVHAQHEQDRDVQRGAAAARRHQRRGQHHEGRPDQRRPDQDLAPGPAVDEHPGERPDQRVRQVQGGEGRRAGRRAGERRGVEEHVRADPGGDDAVTGLGDQPGGEQPPEVPLGQDDPQVAQERGPRWLPPVQLRTQPRRPVSGRPRRG